MTEKNARLNRLALTRTCASLLLLLAASAFGGEVQVCANKKAEALRLAAGIVPSKGQVTLEQCIVRDWPAKKAGFKNAAILALLERNYPSTDGKYHYSVFLLEKGKDKARIVASIMNTEPKWAFEPHWKQKIEKIDIADWRIKPGVYAFGLKLSAEYAYKMAGTLSEQLVLFEPRAANLELVPVLRTQMVCASCTGEEVYDVDCEKNRSSLLVATIGVEKTMSGGYFDLLKHRQPGKQSVVLKWDGQGYAPSGADPLDEKACSPN